MEARINIEELSRQSGLTRRGIRFYVQQGLIRPPHGVGRGDHYDPGHVEEIQQVRRLQASGHSLEQIRALRSGGRLGESLLGAAIAGPAAAPPTLKAGLYRRVELWPGVELSFDASRFNPSVEGLLRLRQAAHEAFFPSAATEDQELSHD